MVTTKPPHLTRAPNLRATKTEGKGNNTNADNETGEVKNGCKPHSPLNWDKSEKVPFLTRAHLPRSRQRKREKGREPKLKRKRKRPLKAKIGRASCRERVLVAV